VGFWVALVAIIAMTGVAIYIIKIMADRR